MNLFIRVTLWSLSYHLIASLIWLLGFSAGMQSFNSSDHNGLNSVLFFIHAILMLPAIMVDFFIQSGNESFTAHLSRGSLGPFPSSLTIVTSIAAGAFLAKMKRAKQS